MARALPVAAWTPQGRGWDGAGAATLGLCVGCLIRVLKPALVFRLTIKV